MIAFETHTQKKVRFMKFSPLEMIHSFFWCCLLPKKFGEMLLRIGFLIYSTHIHQKKKIYSTDFGLSSITATLHTLKKKIFFKLEDIRVYFHFSRINQNYFNAQTKENNISIVQMIKIKCFTIKLTTITQLSFWCIRFLFSSNAYVFLMCYKSSFPR